MTHAEYMKAVLPKVHGTINIHDAFASGELDFMILLSSSTGILGTNGQANYAAGNTFQDAFADAQNRAARSSGRRTRYVSLDIGAVAGSAHVESLPLKGLELSRLGVSFMTFAEVLMLLEYAMSATAVADDFSHSIPGVARAPVAINQDSSMKRKNPMFGLLPDAAVDGDGAGDKTRGRNEQQKQQDPARLLQQAKTLEEAQDVIAVATAAKFSAFLDVDVPLNVPTAQLALDSLVSIELKNWLSRTFQAPVQASEVSGGLSINELARLLAGRSKCISDEVRTAGSGTLGQPENAALAPPAVAVAQTNGTHATSIGTMQSTGSTVVASLPESKTEHGLECCKHSAVLQKQPLPDLDETLDNILENTAHLLDTARLAELEQGVAELRQPDGPARTAFAELVKLHELGEAGWAGDLLARVLYLQRRSPIAPMTSFVGGNPDSAKPQAQSERAALLTAALVEYRGMIIRNEVEPMWFGGKPTCDARLRWLFDAVREPGQTVDKMQLYDAANNPSEVKHVAVLSRGRVFKVVLVDGAGAQVTPASLAATYDAIIGATQEGADAWTGILATDGRTSWADIREASIVRSSNNAEYFSVIETAAFILCLDHGSPDSDEEQVREAYFGDGFNRWCDKTLQVVVSANGKTSFILEHAVLDGSVIWRLSEWVQNSVSGAASTAFFSGADYMAQRADVLLDEIVFESSPETDSRMDLLREQYLATTSRASYANHLLDAFGTEELMAWHMPVKSVLDATVQLAARLHFQRSVQTWEAVSMARYHGGRSEMLQTTTRAAVDFCTLALDQAASATKKRTRLLGLGRELSTNLQRCAAGKGSYLRTLEMLREGGVWPADQPRARLFESNVFWQKPYVIVSHVPSGAPCTIGTIGVQPPGCFFLAVTPRNHGHQAALT
ncbi:hypothetical protein Micbo1qcDRAFT_226268 [Microdochium bolleyi]|uniref:Carrier domain-containing protein n=1 Tax=Microdochium bolleyi TaxID=196109 RepID=A0A136IZJ5_9PEZI|nr:hypothetical protein Micbo1qcDRAFT_226268 [Microdochium bolleyi]